MKNKLLHFLTTTILLLIPYINYGQAPTLGTAAGFVLFTTNGAMTNSGIPHLTHLTGNVGSNLPGAVSGFGNVDGQMHDADAVTVNCVTAVQSLYSQLNLTIPTFNPVSSLIGNGDTLNPGVYQYPLLTATSLSGNLILNAHGNANAVFIMKIDGALSISALSKVKLVNGALACNVFWKVEGLVSMASNATMRGTIVANNAAINLSANDTLEGRALSINGAVTTNAILAYMPIGCGSPVLVGPAAPALVSAAAYGVFSSIGGVTSTPITHVIGDVGSNSTTTTGFNPLFVTGMIHPNPDASTAACAGSLNTVYNYLNGLTVDIDLLDPSNFGYDLVLTPHTYHLGAATFLTGNVYLNAEGNPNAVFVIQVNGAFTTSTFSRIILMNGAQAKNVYWKIDGAVHVFSNSLFNGTIVAAGAITLDVTDTLNGRALTINGAVAINGASIDNNPAPCVAAPIVGASAVCVGATTTYTDVDTGGKWSSINPLIASIDSISGVATGVTAGVDTIIYTTSLACVDSIVITVNAAAATITGLSSVCTGSNITLSDTSSNGSWTSSNSLQATVGLNSGIVTGITTGIPIIKYTLLTGCFATKNITVNPASNAGVINGANTVCTGSSITLTDTTSGGTWSSSNATATVLNGLVTGVTAGIDTIKYTVTNLCGTTVASKIITVNPASNAGVINGANTVCTGSSITLTDTTSGGTWSSSNATATVLNGLVTGVNAGLDTIKYTVTNLCGTTVATKIITVNPASNAGVINGLSAVCTGSSITLTDTTSGGTWSSSNATATVLNGVVTGVTAGIDTIKYTVTNLCGTTVASKIITVNPASNAGVINGANTVCTGSSITLTDTTSGGVWSSSNATATVLNGVVTGVTAGIDTIKYTVTNLCGTTVASKIITVNPASNAGVINGLSAVCTGSSITLTDTTSGGTWSSSNATATVLNGVVTGVTAGIDTIKYTVTNLCGTTVASKIITIYPASNAGVINGANTVCTGSTITLTDTTSGGTWSSSNATATVLNGLVTGVTAGIDTIKYTVTNLCGTTVASKIITVNPASNAGVINGLSAVCTGSSITLTDTTSGGTWSSSNATATVLNGLVTGVTAGIDTIKYTVTNLCGTTVATKMITVNPASNAGVINGANIVCTGSSITLTDTTSGGTWSSSNATATVLNGVVTGVTAGIDTIKYTVTNLCGTTVASKIITVNPASNPGVINGPNTVCIGSSITLTDTTSGGTWSSSNATATVLNGVVTGVSTGIDTIKYTLINLCGATIATQIITVNPAPNAGVITGASTVCAGSSITLTDTTTGGTWSSSNTNAALLGSLVLGVTSGIDTISYTVTSACGTGIATHIVTINPNVNAGIITGPSNACIGTSITLVDVIPGGIWSSSNNTATVSGGIVTGVITGVDTIRYSVNNACGSATTEKIITVNIHPSVPTITTHAPSTVCAGTMYQNFGTSTPAPVNTSYNWTATNATVFAQGAFHQYALVSFNQSGTSNVTLNVTTVSTGCTSQTSMTVNTGTDIAQTDVVSYFNNHFVCTPNNNNSYQWGYDDAQTLDSTLLTGEINQDYINASPDNNKYYWVMTNMGNCAQKTYYTLPTTLIENVNNEIGINVYPNPANYLVNIDISSSYQGLVEIDILNMMGQKMISVNATDHKTAIDVASLPNGHYLINCYHNGTKIAGSRFIKN